MNNSRRAGCVLAAGLFLTIFFAAVGLVVGIANMQSWGVVGPIVGTIVGAGIGGFGMVTLRRRAKLSDWLHEHGIRQTVTVSSVQQRDTYSYYMAAWSKDPETGQIHNFEWKLEYRPKRWILEKGVKSWVDIQEGNIVDVLISPENPSIYSMDTRKTYIVSAPSIDQFS